MHPETNNNTKHTLSYTDRKIKAITTPWFSRPPRHPARKLSGSILGHKTKHTYLLTFPRPTQGAVSNSEIKVRHHACQNRRAAVCGRSESEICLRVKSQTASSMQSLP